MRGEQRGLGQQLHLQRQQIAEDARKRDHHVNTRPAQLRQRGQCGTGKPAIAVEARLGAHQRKRLRDRPAFGFQIIRAPEHHRYRFGQAVAVGLVPFQQALCLAGAILHREG